MSAKSKTLLRDGPPLQHTVTSLLHFTKNHLRSANGSTKRKSSERKRRVCFCAVFLVPVPMYRALSCSDEIGAPPEVDIVGIIAEEIRRRQEESNAMQGRYVGSWGRGF